MKKETAIAAQSTIDFLLETAETNGPATMFEFTVPAGAKVPVTYYHEQLNETIYGVERIITFTVEAKAIDIAPGEKHFIPCVAVPGMAN
ncbi:MAG: hypothetical protein ABI416_10210 [Ginsengibacter sp.]